MVAADIFFVKNKTPLYIVDYYSKFLYCEKCQKSHIDDLVKTPKILFTELGVPKNILSDAGMNFTSETTRQFIRQMNID